MNTQEKEILTQFLDQLVNAKVDQKDLEADSMIRSATQSQPDSHYLLVQRAMLQNEALANAQNRINALQSEIDQLKANTSNTSFLGSNAWGNHITQFNRPLSTSSTQPSASSGYSQQPITGSNNSWLGSVATTAAGVVAGSFLFQGIENLMSHRGYDSFSGNHQGETIVNNYYNSPDPTQLSSDNANFADSSSLTDGDFLDSTSTDDSSDWV